MTQYVLTLRNGQPLVTILPLENDGPGSSNSPVPVTYVSPLSTPPYFVIAGDYSARFVKGFPFSAIGDTIYDGEYQTSSDSEYSNGTTRVYVDKINTPSETAIRTPVTITNVKPPALPSLVYECQNETTPLLLVGHGNKSYNTDTTWGEVVQQNLVHLTENFAGVYPPGHPLRGQLWFNSSTLELCVWLGAEWAPLPTTATIAEIIAQIKPLDRDISFDSVTISTTPTSPNHATTKQYVDSYVNGVIWKSPILDPNVVSDAHASPPDTATPHDTTYLVVNGEGLWEAYEGHLVSYDGYRWNSVLGRQVQTGDRFGIQIEPTDDVLASFNTSGSFVGKAGQIATVTSTSPYKYAFEVPVEPDAVAVVSTRAGRSLFAGRGYTFKGTYGRGQHGDGYRWIEFVFNPPERSIVFVPASSTSPGEIGDIAADGVYVYVYGTNGWARIPHTQF